jgi:ribosomal 50S subunit-recycling heat shock protein
MRLDLFLKLTRIIKQRTVAKQACDAGAVTVNGAAVKPGVAVQQGDRLFVDLPNFRLEAEILEVPQRGNVPKGQIERYVRIVSRQAKDPRSYVFGSKDSLVPPSDPASGDRRGSEYSTGDEDQKG